MHVRPYEVDQWASRKADMYNNCPQILPRRATMRTPQRMGKGPGQWTSIPTGLRSCGNRGLKQQ